MADARLTAVDSPPGFEEAADAIVAGDLLGLERLLRAEPGLAGARSGREHHATLLHYTAANGVEEYRQKTPGNIVAVADLLLRNGSDVDATADMYGGGCTTLGLAATSVHPERAGVQEALLETLLQHGARFEEPGKAGHGHSMVNACLANGRLRAAEFFARRVRQLSLAEAAALGRFDEVKSFFTDDGCGGQDPPREQLNEAFFYACQFGRRQIVAFLLGSGADLTAHDMNGQTGLHWAVIGGDQETIAYLLAQGAPLEVENSYGGTVLGQALWSAAHSETPKKYLPVLEMLAGAGARIPQGCPPINPAVDGWLRRHASRA